MDNQKQLSLLRKCTTLKSRDTLFELFTDLDDSNFEYDSAKIDLIKEFNEFLPEKAEDKEYSEARQELLDCLKRGNTEFEADMCIKLKDKNTGQDTDKYWIFNIDQAPTPSDLYNEGWESLSGIKIDSVFSKDKTLQLKKDFFNYLEEKYTFPHTESVPNSSRPNLIKKTYLPWRDELWSAKEISRKNDLQEFSGEIAFLEELLGIYFRKAADRRKEQFLNAHPTLKAERSEHLKYLVGETLKGQPKIKELRSGEVDKILATVDKMLFKLYPEYKAACLVI